MTIRPPRRVRASETLVPRARRRSSSTRSASGSVRAGHANARRRLRLAQSAGELLGLADREAPADDDVEQAGLGRRVEADERSGVSLADPAVGQRRLDGRVEVEQAERVGDRGPGTADLPGDGLLGEPELVDELSIGLGLLEWRRGPRAGCSRRGRARAGAGRRAGGRRAGIRSRPASRAARTRRSPATSW